MTNENKTEEEMEYKVTCSRKLDYRWKTDSGRWTNTERFERVAMKSEIEELKKSGYKVTILDNDTNVG